MNEKERLKDRWIVKITINGIPYTISLESDYPNIRCNWVEIWKDGETAEKVDYDFKLIVCNRVENKEKDLNSKSKSNEC